MPLPTPCWSGLLDLTELELDRGRASENENRHAQATLVVIDFLDGAVEVVEGAVADADQFAGLEQHLRAGLVDAVLHAAKDDVRLGVLDRQRTLARSTDEAHHLRGFLDEVPALVVDARNAAALVRLDLDQHVTREELALGLALLSGTHFHHFFGRHKHLAEPVLHFGARYARIERALHLVLEARVGVYHIPTLGQFRLLSYSTTA